MTGRPWPIAPRHITQAEQRERAAGVICRREHREHWVVVQRHGNASAFSGYHWTPSDYSCVQCLAPGCRRRWRTKAAYVETLPDAARERL